ncbi:transporter substrate-binding domain-containing protein [Rhodobacteraceae bacterium NNCM2]|nr:transporter substrate-binding domain-containing protein [Coraliihabitans acroporae]
MTDAVVREIAATGTLRVAINLGNILLVTDRAADGTPIGVAPDLSRALADRLGVGISLVPMALPGEVADAISGPEIDMGLIAHEAERAQTVAFSNPYVEIEATYLVTADAPFQSIEEVDAPGTRIAVCDRSAYDLYLKRTLKHAELVRGEGLDGTFEMFRHDKMQVLAGLRPALIGNADSVPGGRILPGRYMSVQQSIGVKPSSTHALAYINDFLAEARDSGLIASLLDRHGVSDSLTVA